MYIGDWDEEQNGYYLGKFENNSIFVCHPSLQQTAVTWDEAMNTNISGFELPTKEESNFIYNQINKFNLFKKKLGFWYWNGIEASPDTFYAWNHAFNNGYQIRYFKDDNSGYARFIRKVPL